MGTRKGGRGKEREGEAQVFDVRHSPDLTVLYPSLHDPCLLPGMYCVPSLPCGKIAPSAFRVCTQ